MSIIYKDCNIKYNKKMHIHPPMSIVLQVILVRQNIPIELRYLIIKHYFPWTVLDTESFKKFRNSVLNSLYCCNRETYTDGNDNLTGAFYDSQISLIIFREYPLRTSEMIRMISVCHESETNGPVFCESSIYLPFKNGRRKVEYEETASYVIRIFLLWHIDNFIL